MRNKLVELRPIIPTIDHTTEMSDEEAFQNTTIRPILKFQNEVLLFLFKQHIQKFEKLYYSLTISERVLFIKQQIQKDLPLKNSLLGMVIGHFTLEEFKAYTKAEKELKRRINDMIVQRLQDQMGYFDE